ncbi:MAG: UDP-N-acetylmuramate dehydrogenase [Clostridiales bacterium]|nr:UDP-N-acetylmuramate dehydrogenase [Clostridiales bacterium]
MEETISFLKNNDIYFTESEDLKLRSSFRIGQKADLAIFPDSDEKLIKTVLFFKKRSVKYLILGRCSNVLFPDYNINYPLIFTDRLISLQFDDDNPNYLICDSGVSLAKLVNFAAQYGFGGMEFAGGIPGSVGGAVCMNAGAYGKNISDVLLWTDYINQDGKILKISNKEHSFGYRKSIFTNNDVIIRSCFFMKKMDISDIKNEIRTLSLKRRNSQPLEFPSAGSVFKRPDGYYVGAMVDECGLKGFNIGGAEVSKKHSGFIINTGNATASDVKELISFVRQKVYDKFKVNLECEIRFID